MESTPSLRRETSQSTLCVHVEPKKEPVSTATPLLDLDDATLAPQGWPTSPSRIKHSLSDKLLNGAFDIALFTFSACFLVFSLVAMSYDGVSTSENPTATRVLSRATKYSPTVFPLLFASVVGRATHAILLWRLEKGERIKILDMLATSTSLTSTVTSQIQLRQISVLSVLLVAIWALSPVGGQASLRQMTIETVVKRSDALFQYVVPINNDPPKSFSFIPIMTNLLITTMFAASSTQTSPNDLWGNVKVPKIEYYEKTSEPDINGWFTTGSEEDRLATYSSFAGISIAGAQDRTTTADFDFHIQTEYLQLACATDDAGGLGIQWNPEVNLTSDIRSVAGGDNLIWWSRPDSMSRLSTALEVLEPFNFSYTNYWWNNFSIACSAQTSYVEVEVSCAVNSTCQAVKVRRSQLPQFPPAFTLLDWNGPFHWKSLLRGVMRSIGGNSDDPESDLFWMYLLDSSLGYAYKDLDRRERKVSNETWSDRFGLLINSYWTCLYSMHTATDGIDANTSYSWDSNITFEPPKIDFDGSNSLQNYNWTGDGTYKSKVWTSQGNKYEHVEVMVAHKPWAVTLAIASLVLIAFSIVPPLVRHFLTNGPDIAMNFSSLATRNNSHIPIPAGGSFLPAADRFRLLRDVRLRFADAEGKSDVGNLVIASEGVEKAEFAGVCKGRLYD